MDALQSEGGRRPANAQRKVLERTRSLSCLLHDGVCQKKDNGGKKTKQLLSAPSPGATETVATRMISQLHSHTSMAWKRGRSEVLYRAGKSWTER